MISTATAVDEMHITYIMLISGAMHSTHCTYYPHTYYVNNCSANSGSVNSGFRQGAASIAPSLWDLTPTQSSLRSTCFAISQRERGFCLSG